MPFSLGHGLATSVGYSFGYVYFRRYFRLHKEPPSWFALVVTHAGRTAWPAASVVVTASSQDVNERGCGLNLAGRLGFEPRQSAPKALDLPLVDRPVKQTSQPALDFGPPIRPKTGQIGQKGT